MGATLAGDLPEGEALAGYEQARDAALREVFRLTRALAAFPRPARFAELQTELSGALEREATYLASRPAPAGLGRGTRRVLIQIKRKARP